MATKREKVQKNLEYMKVQIERFLKKNYRIQFRGKVFANKSLYKQHRYGVTTFKSGGECEVDIAYDVASGSDKGFMLQTVFREAVRIGCALNGKRYLDGEDDYEKELSKYGLVSYGGLPERGLDLHTYSCSECKKVWILKKNKLSATKDPEQTGVLTGCCRAGFKYEGKVYYSNKDLQKVKKR
ncbi:hypothetical protein MOD96_01920 [Bacillus sp. S17B2]|uniref:hypothetical protein n=1 Tax=Bacillus sp. S17B2 TaxID=2918907 RepID=UPI0022826D26|nr:hypothetical protein [Bacillus sp. S17B2]